jgi:hypothetical protein
MKKILGLLLLFLTSSILLLAATKTKYHHVRTSKRAWSQVFAGGMDDFVVHEPEIYVSDDSLLISVSDSLKNFIVTLTDYLHDNKEVISQQYDRLPSNTEERIAITDLSDGIYEITFSHVIFLDPYTKLTFACFGYFAKGEQYEQQAEVLGISVPTAADKSKNIVHDINGRKVPLNAIHKGKIYIMGRKKILYQ